MNKQTLLKIAAGFSFVAGTASLLIGDVIGAGMMFSAAMLFWLNIK